MYNKLAGRMRELRLSQEDVGYALGLSGPAISRRFTGTVEWTVNEAYRVMEMCRVDPGEFTAYFPPVAVKKSARKGCRKGA